MSSLARLLYSCLILILGIVKRCKFNASREREGALLSNYFSLQYWIDVYLDEKSALFEDFDRKGTCAFVNFYARAC